MLAEIIAMIEERAVPGQLDEPTAWRDRMKPLTAGHFVRWLPQSHRNAMALVDNVRAGHGLELDEGQEDDTDPYIRALRDAGLDVPEPETLGERAARERARRKQALVNRRVDARALMEVRRLAASVGPVNPGRFNAAYRQLHPMFTSEERRRRALVLTHEDRRIVATVRGPHDTEFRVSWPAGTDERAVIGTLLHRIEIVIPRSAGRPKAQAVDPTPKDTTDTREPSVDVDRGAQESGAHATVTGADEPEAVVDVMGEIKKLVSMLFEGSKHEAIATPGSGDQKDVDAVEEGRLAGEPVDTEERTIEDGSAGPEPRGEPAPGCLGMVEQEGVALAADPGVGAEVDAPTEHVIVRRACQRGLGFVDQAQAPPLTRQQGDGRAQRGRSPPTPRRYARMGPRNRGPPPHPRQ